MRSLDSFYINSTSNFSLGGNTKTVIICTITAAEEEQTKSTLEFASRAKRIVNHAKVTNFALLEDWGGGTQNF